MSKLKAFADDKRNTILILKIVLETVSKTLWEKEKMLVTSIFSFSHKVFNRIFYWGSLKRGNVWLRVNSLLYSLNMDPFPATSAVLPCFLEIESGAFEYDWHQGWSRVFEAWNMQIAMWDWEIPPTCHFRIHSIRYQNNKAVKSNTKTKFFFCWRGRGIGGEGRTGQVVECVCVCVCGGGGRCIKTDFTKRNSFVQCIWGCFSKGCALERKKTYQWFYTLSLFVINNLYERWLLLFDSILLSVHFFPLKSPYRTL